MSVLDWIIEALAIGIVFVNLRSFRMRVRAGVGISPPGNLMMALLILSVLFVHIAGVSRLHLFWLFPACIILGITRLPFPLSIVYLPSYFLGRVLAIGAYHGSLAQDAVAFRGAITAAFRQLSILTSVSPLALPCGVLSWLGATVGLGMGLHGLYLKQFAAAAIGLGSMLVFLLASHFLDQAVIATVRPLIDKLIPDSRTMSLSRTQAIVTAVFLASGGTIILWVSWKL